MYKAADKIKMILKRIQKDGLVIFCIVVFAALYHVFFMKVLNGICPIKCITGYPCPGCGITRACISVFHLKLMQAFMLNPSFVSWGLFFAFFVVRRYIMGRTNDKAIMYFLIAVIIAAIVIYIIRMVLLYPSEPVLTYYEDNLFSHFFP